MRACGSPSLSAPPGSRPLGAGQGVSGGARTWAAGSDAAALQPVGGAGLAELAALVVERLGGEACALTAGLTSPQSRSRAAGGNRNREEM